MEHDLTRGNVLKTIAVFALPYMLSYFLQMLYGMADLYMMGQFSGAAGITAVGNGAQTLYIITVTLVGLAMGTTVIVGHAVGSRRFDRAETAIGNTITLFMGVSVVLAVILLALCPQIVALIGTPPEAVEGTAAYLRICFVGIPFIAAYNILSAIFRGLGDSRSPMYVIGVACIINIALDFLFIGHMGLGPVGAALGTVTAQTASVALALVWLKSRRTNIHVKRSDLRPQPEVLGSILKIGVPVAVQDGCIQVAFMFITVIANHRGLVDAAARPGRKDDQLLVHCAEFHGCHRQRAHSAKRRRGQGRPCASGTQGRHDHIGSVRLPNHGADVAGGAGVYRLFCQGSRGCRGRYRLYAQLHFRRNLCRHPHLL